MPTELTITTATDADAANWNAFVDDHPHACVYHRFEWGEVFRAAYGTACHRLLASRGGTVTGVLPLVTIARGPLAPVLVGLPYFAHGGALASDEASWCALVDAANGLRRRVGARHVELRHAHPVPAGALPAHDEKVTMQMALEPTIAEFERRAGSKLRADVRRPQKEGMTVTIAGREGLGAFHDVYSAVMRELGSPCHAPAVFDEAMSRFAERTFIACVRYQGRAVGAAFLVGQGDTLEVPCAGTLHALNKLRPNMLLYWSILCAAIERGYKRFSFGRSTRDAGTYHFKKNWGASPVPLPYHYVVGNGERVPSRDGAKPWLARASSAWTRMPLGVTRRLGPHLVRHLP